VEDKSVMKRMLIVASVVAGSMLAGPVLTSSSALAAPGGASDETSGVLIAQAAPTATPAFRPAATPTPAGRPASSTAPRAGDFPLDLAAMLLAGGALAFGGGAVLLRRARGL
jgi:hypothetical protein